MLDAILRTLAKFLLGLRYRIRVFGVDEIARRGRTGILFLPNHPALIDPVILMTYLHRTFAPRALADEDQIRRSGFAWLLHRVGVRPLRDSARHGADVRGEVETVVRETADGLLRGENALLYPSGHLYRKRFEDLRGNSAVESILRLAPHVRIVLVRTRGLWGSRFSFASGEFPNFVRTIRWGIGVILKNFVFFTPRRRVTIELFEPEDLPRSADRHVINAQLERFYNADAPPGAYVPFYFWERGGTRELPDPDFDHFSGDASNVPDATRDIVYEHLRKLTGVAQLRDEMRLAQDLGLDSLSRAEIAVWLGSEFGFHAADAASLLTVGDVLLAACGHAGAVRAVELKPPPPRWFVNAGKSPRLIPDGDTITRVFLAQARRQPGKVAIADQLSGVKTYRDVITAVLALKPLVQRLEGERVGIMLPASVAAAIAYLTVLFAGKTPVMVNWTTGSRNIAHSLDLTGVRRVLTAGPLVARIEQQGTDLSAIRDRLLPLEFLAGQISFMKKLFAALTARLSWAGLDRVRPADTAVVLLTSGSEALPKAVPLSHGNVLTNLRDVLALVRIFDSDSLIGFLPPFHSFGISVTTVLPLVGGVRIAYHPNPTESAALAQLIEAHRASIIVGTPTFLSGIVRASREGQLRTLRIAVTGAEKCPPGTYDALTRACPGLTTLEGYGVTECSPIVAANAEADPRPGTIGRILPSLEYALVDEDSGSRAPTGSPGMLLVRGPSVFAGYLGDVASPFVEFEGKPWYRTGDLVREDADGVLTFVGRRKRFIKLGGEMISLPAIEAVLVKRFASDADEGPVLAVEATPNEERPEIVLFTTLDIDRAAANQLIREAQLSGLHNIARVIRIDAIPILGTGKTDYRALKEKLRE